MDGPVAEKNAPDINQGALVDTTLVGLIDQLIGFAGFYPPGHDRCRDGAAHLESALGAMGGGFQLRIGARHILCGGIPLPEEDAAVARLGTLLRTLGVAAIEILPGVSADDLLTFAIRLAEMRARAETTVKLGSIELLEFPQKVRVIQREFGARVVCGAGPDSDRDPVEEALAQVVEVLDGYELTGDQWDHCRDFATRVLQRAVQRLEVMSDGTPPDEMKRSLHEVLDLGVHAIEHAIRELLAHDDAGAGSMDSIYDRAMKALALSDDHASVDVMLDVLRESKKEHESDRPSGSGSSDHQLTTAELRERIASVTADFREPDLTRIRHRDESLGVVLQLLDHPVDSRAAINVVTWVEKELDRNLSEADWDTIVGFVTETIGRGNLPAADRNLGVILRSLRRGSGRSGMRLLDAIVERGEPVEEVIWPHVVNELLLGLDAAESERAMGHLVGRRIRQDSVLRLERLEALRAARVDPMLFRPVRPELVDLYECLLRTERRDEIGPRLLEGMQHSPGCTGHDIAMVLREYSDRYAEMLIAALRGGEDTALRERVAREVVEEITGLPDSIRNATWVNEMIRSLGTLPAQVVAPLLERIQTERKWVFLHRWPASCRRAARAADQLLSLAGESA